MPRIDSWPPGSAAEALTTEVGAHEQSSFEYIFNGKGPPLPQLRPRRCRGAGQAARGRPVGPGLRGLARPARVPVGKEWTTRSRPVCGRASSWWRCSRRMPCAKKASAGMAGLCPIRLQAADRAAAGGALRAHFVIFRLDYIDLTAWRDSPDRYKLGFRRLLDAIQAHFRGEPPRYRRWDDRFPQFDFGPFLYDKRGISAAGNGCSSGSTPGAPIPTGIAPADHR